MIPIFIISLPCSEDRRKDITYILQKLDMEFHFVDAFDQNSPVVEWYSYLCVPKEDERVAEDTGAYRGRPGKKEIACYLSHLKALKEVANLPEGKNHAIVCEDDVTFRKDLKEVLKQYDFFSYDLVHLSYLFHQQEGEEGMYPTPLAISGGQCYLLKKSYAKYLVDKFDHPVRLIVPREELNVTSELLLQNDINSSHIYTPVQYEPHKVLFWPPLAVERRQNVSIIGNSNKHGYWDQFCYDKYIE